MIRCRDLLESLSIYLKSSDQAPIDRFNNLQEKMVKVSFSVAALFLTFFTVKIFNTLHFSNNIFLDGNVDQFQDLACG